MSRNAVLVLGAILTLALTGCGGGGSSSGEGSPQTFSNADLEGTWIVQVTNTAFGDPLTLSLVFEVDDLNGTITKAVIRRFNTVAPFDFIADTTLDTSIDLSESGELTLISTDPLNGGAIVFTLEGQFAADGVFFSGEVLSTPAAESVSDQLEQDMDGPLNAARFDAALSGRLPNKTFTVFDGPSSETFTIGTEAGYLNGRIETIDGLGSTIQVTLTYSETNDGWTIFPTIVAPDGTIEFWDMLVKTNFTEVMTLLENESYFVGVGVTLDDTDYDSTDSMNLAIMQSITTKPSN